MKLNLNLASRRYVNKRAVTHGFIAALCLMLIFTGWSLKRLFDENTSLQLNQQAVSQVESQIQQLRGGPVKPLSPAERASLEKEYAAVDLLLRQDAFRWTELLDRMEKLMPAGVSLSGFSPNYEKNSLAISGRARSLTEMRGFLDRLLKDGDFQQVFLSSHSRSKIRDYADKERDIITFSILLEGVF